MKKAFEDAFRLDGQVALITGGGTGLGYAIAESLLAAGAQVVITGRREDVLQQACKKLGDGAFYRVHDVTDTNGAKAFIDGLTRDFGRLDILVNNAGRHCKKEIADVTQKDLQAVLDVHVFGSYALAQAALPGMIERGHGRLIFISSMSAYLAMTKVTAYGAAKSAVLGLVKCMSGEVADKGVTVNAIAPGFIDTPMFHQAVDGDLPRQRKILGHTPMNCYGDPADVGWAAVYLASPAARFVTGVCLPVDGGCSIGF